MITPAKRFASLRQKLRTKLTSEQLSALPQSIRSRALFSARVESARVLTRLYDGLNKIADRFISGPGDYENVATLRAAIKDDLLGPLEYKAPPGKAGTIEDLSSDARLNLVIQTQQKMAQGYGRFIEQQDPVSLLAAPAQELVRTGKREVPRDWVTRWREAGGQFYDGRMIARKDDPIWTAISAFGEPFPPFDFNSGMGVEDVDRAEAIQLGVITQSDRVMPQTRDFNAGGVEAAAGDLSPEMVSQLQGLGYRFENGVLSL